MYHIRTIYILNANMFCWFITICLITWFDKTCAINIYWYVLEINLAWSNMIDPNFGQKWQNQIWLLLIFLFYFLSHLALSQRRTCRPPSPSEMTPIIFWLFWLNIDAQCSESNENMNEKIFRYLFFELSSKIGVIFSEKWH